jgi:hypothetical protein
MVKQIQFAGRKCDKCGGVFTGDGLNDHFVFGCTSEPITEEETPTVCVLCKREGNAFDVLHVYKDWDSAEAAKDIFILRSYVDIDPEDMVIMELEVRG